MSPSQAEFRGESMLSRLQTLILIRLKQPELNSLFVSFFIITVLFFKNLCRVQYHHLLAYQITSNISGIHVTTIYINKMYVRNSVICTTSNITKVYFLYVEMWNQESLWTLPYQVLGSSCRVWLSSYDWKPLYWF